MVCAKVRSFVPIQTSKPDFVEITPSVTPRPGKRQTCNSKSTNMGATGCPDNWFMIHFDIVKKKWETYVTRPEILFFVWSEKKYMKDVGFVIILWIVINIRRLKKKWKIACTNNCYNFIMIILWIGFRQSNL